MVRIQYYKGQCYSLGLVSALIQFTGTRKPPCLSAVAAVMIYIKRSPRPASPCVQALQGHASLLRACGEQGCAYRRTQVNVYTVCYHGHMCMCKHTHLYRSASQQQSACRPRPLRPRPPSPASRPARQYHRPASHAYHRHSLRHVTSQTLVVLIIVLIDAPA